MHGLQGVPHVETAKAPERAWDTNAPLRFRAETDRMTRDIGETYTPMPGTERARLPGAVEEERMQLHRREGVRYGEMEQAAARDVCGRLGVALPWD